MYVLNQCILSLPGQSTQPLIQYVTAFLHSVGIDTDAALKYQQSHYLSHSSRRRTTMDMAESFMNVFGVLHKLDNMVTD
jgi:hypothetical protein